MLGFSLSNHLPFVYSHDFKNFFSSISTRIISGPILQMQANGIIYSDIWGTGANGENIDSYIKYKITTVEDYDPSVCNFKYLLVSNPFFIISLQLMKCFYYNFSIIQMMRFCKLNCGNYKIKKS